jgi:hypothetical protein
MHYPTSVTCLTYSFYRTLSLVLCNPLKKWGLDPQRHGLLTMRVSHLIIRVSLPQYLPMALNTLGAILFLHIRRLTVTTYFTAHKHITTHKRRTLLHTLHTLGAILLSHFRRLTISTHIAHTTAHMRMTLHLSHDTCPWPWHVVHGYAWT